MLWFRGLACIIQLVVHSVAHASYNRDTNSIVSLNDPSRKHTYASHRCYSYHNHLLHHQFTTVHNVFCCYLRLKRWQPNQNSRIADSGLSRRDKQHDTTSQRDQQGNSCSGRPGTQFIINSGQKALHLSGKVKVMCSVLDEGRRAS